MQSDVRIFMEACGQAVENRPSFTDENYKQAVLYLNLIREEMQELEEGFENQDVVETADACGDLIWVILGLCNTLGIPMGPVWQEITSSMTSSSLAHSLARASSSSPPTGRNSLLATITHHHPFSLQTSALQVPVSSCMDSHQLRAAASSRPASTGLFTSARWSKNADCSA